MQKKNKPLKTVKSYQMDIDLNRRMKEYADKHRYTMCSCVEAAFILFLEKNGQMQTDQKP
jgi:hypothetical protein